MKPRTLVGAVVYDPKVVTIWNSIIDFFGTQGYAMDCVFYNSYELMVDALLAGHIQIAWNSPLAWVDAMRRTDRDRKTHIVVRRGSGLERLEDLRSTILATGARDSPQA